MNLDFGILWVEDAFDANEQQQLEQHILNSGFQPRITTTIDGADIAQFAAENNIYHNIDLVLLDYKLGDTFGDDLAVNIRTFFPSTTILFYSGSFGSDGSELRAKMAAKQVEGVFCSHRDRFIIRASELIDQTAHSLSRLSGMRGLAAQVVSECDEKLSAALLSMTARSEACRNAVSRLDEAVCNHLKDTSRRYIAATKTDLDGRLATLIVDSAKKFAHYQRLTNIAIGSPAEFGLDTNQVDRLRELRRATNNYSTEVLSLRNTLSHQIEIRSADGWTLQGRGEISVADFPDFRQRFARYLANITEMISLTTPTEV
jgi:hypothetical protein